MGLLDIIIIVLVLSWLLGFTTFRGALGSLLHIILVIAVLLLIVRIFT